MRLTGIVTPQNQFDILQLYWMNAARLDIVTKSDGMWFCKL
jgi:hypothetical protein